MLEIVGMTAKDVNWDLSTVQKNCGNQYALSVNRIKGSQIKFGAEEWSPESSEKAVSDRGCPKQRGSQLESSRDAQPSGVLPGPRCPDISKRKARGCASIWQRLPDLSRRSDVDRQPWASQKKKYLSTSDEVRVKTVRCSMGWLFSSPFLSRTWWVTRSPNVGQADDVCYNDVVSDDWQFSHCFCMLQPVMTRTGLIVYSISSSSHVTT